MGCDGIKSQVRKLFLGEGDRTSKAVLTGKYCYRRLVPADKAIEMLGEDLALNSQMCKRQPLDGKRHDADQPDLGNHGHVLTTLIEQGKTVNVVATHTKEDGKWNEDRWVRPSTKEQLLADFDGWIEPVKNILSLVETPDIWALFNHLPAPTHHRKGKICLLGDAAHASIPHHGAGAGMAMEDSFILSKVLASIQSVGELENAFAADDAVHRPRSQRLVTSGRRTGEIYDFEDEVIGDNIEALREYLEHGWD